MRSTKTKTRSRFQFSNDMIDQFAKKLHREVDDFKIDAKDMIKTNASNTWNDGTETPSLPLSRSQ